jgi:hypothetical protein
MGTPWGFAPVEIAGSIAKVESLYAAKLLNRKGHLEGFFLLAATASRFTTCCAGRSKTVYQDHFSSSNVS